MALLRFLLFAFAGYLLFRLIGRYVLPWLGKKAVKKAKENMEERMEEQRSGQKIYESGDVLIRKPKASQNQREETGGDDYIDYEEVK